MKATFDCGDKVVVRRTGTVHEVRAAWPSLDRPEPFYKLDNGTHYWEHELKGEEMR